MADRGTSNNADETPTALKTGTSEPQKHKRFNMKQSRVKGIEFINWKGQVVGPRQTGEKCDCKMECFKAFNEEELAKVLANLNEFNTKNEQDMYLQSLIEIHRVKTRRPRKADPKEKLCSFRYFVLKNGIRIRVCKKSFVSIHGITPSRVRRLGSLLQQGCPPRDRRGLNSKGKSAQPEAIFDHFLLSATKKVKKRKSKTKVEKNEKEIAS